MEGKLNTIQALIGVLNSPIAQRKGVSISPEHCKIWVEELSKFMQEFGWHPASESPELGEDDDNEFIVIASVDNELYRHGPMIDRPKKAMFIDGQWTEPNVKWWIAPPENKK